VLPEKTEAAVNAAIERVRALARRLRLAAIVLQPPDNSLISTEVLVRHGLFVELVRSVIRATGIVSLEGGADGAVKRMSAKARQQWRSACRQGVTLVLGDPQRPGAVLPPDLRERQAPAPDPELGPGGAPQSAVGRLSRQGQPGDWTLATAPPGTRNTNRVTSMGFGGERPRIRRVGG
jgi:hypothetical protein